MGQTGSILGVLQAIESIIMLLGRQMHDCDREQSNSDTRKLLFR